MPGYLAAQRLGISGFLVSRITGTVFVTRGSRELQGNSRLNIGLNLKFNKKNEEVSITARGTYYDTKARKC